MNTSVSIFAEIPEELYESLKNFLETHPNWDLDRVFTAALSLFLLQNQNDDISQSITNYHACTQVCLETFFEQSD
ncbi:hypothetical protein RGRSB_0385 [cyanobacterium endosymbiont of Rhopalodia gibberula]|uniref:DUF2811 domain-containing protein n=1 Tax=cyanobacterium endosymbiont of Rhopalodia gibberula TaxID=1763363 RepID=UPI000DC700D9|nr:DUF2811 domain-containing protein [cyanobacterium endosymbiont of Rhopalodia gibberula]BBA78972.1 hypothetical protein RGRSB_0385 [cyanobacterium endosymbiont of Rhopalodia gibberula]